MTERWTWSDETAAEITLRWRAWTDAVSARDVDTLAGILHDDYLYVTINGWRLNKDDYLAMVRGLAPGGGFELKRTSARLHPSGRIAEFDGEYYTGGLNSSGQDLSAHTRFTATWVKGDDEQWRGLTHHGTRYDPAAPEKGEH
jgi:ketosteroid isomerase-like protein